MNFAELKELASSTVIITKPGATLPPPITRADCERDPSLGTVRRMAKLGYAIQLTHINEVMRSVLTSKISAEHKEELRKELRTRFDAVKAECLLLFPE